MSEQKRIDAVKKILEDYDVLRLTGEGIIEEICQLFLIPELKVLSDEELGNIEWTETPTRGYSADFSFIDDYRKEIKVILKAQVDKIQRKIKGEE